ncbi:MAG: SDR family oxidoreductase [Dehalococcoidia bacterium]|nr:SDR family oxidoreductase [Dehalococcoidia bacterium]
MNKNGVLAGKVTVITGASRGIGQAIAYRYAQEARRSSFPPAPWMKATTCSPVALTASSSASAMPVAKPSPSSATFPTKKSASFPELIRATEAAYGPVDILVNNASITYFIPVDDFPERRMKLMFSPGLRTFPPRPARPPKMREGSRLDPQHLLTCDAPSEGQRPWPRRHRSMACAGPPSSAPPPASPPKPATARSA